jgi:outer membrane protein OmpA-like peptidoglycan-associated protein
MRNKYTLPTIMLVSAAISACSTQPEKNAALDDARSSYSAARSNPDVSNLSPVELQQAEEAMNRANEASESRKDRDTVNHLSYLAKQRALIAQETAKLKTAEIAVDNATAERDKIRLEMRTAEVDTAKRRTTTAQQKADMTAAELAIANANIERNRRNLEAQRAETEAANKQAMISQESADQKMAELTAANTKVVQMEAELRTLNAKKTERGLVITLSDVLFDTNQSELRAGGVNNLNKLAEFLKEYPERKVLIEGFTDSTGSLSYNLDLSSRRAASVSKALRQMGVSGDRVSTRGYGVESPVASNTTASGRQMNRRVEIILSDENGNIMPR